MVASHQKRTTLHLCFCNKVLWLKQSKEERAYFDAQFQANVPSCPEITVPGAWDSCPYGIHSQEIENKECTWALQLPLFIQSGFCPQNGSSLLPQAHQWRKSLTGMFRGHLLGDSRFCQFDHINHHTLWGNICATYLDLKLLHYIDKLLNIIFICFKAYNDGHQSKNTRNNECYDLCLSCSL